MSLGKLLISGEIIKEKGMFVAINEQKESLVSGKTGSTCQKNLFFWCFKEFENTAFTFNYSKTREKWSFYVYEKGRFTSNP